MSAQKWLFITISPIVMLPALLFVVGMIWVSWFGHWIEKGIDQ
jgi:hypothetical protein